MDKITINGVDYVPASDQKAEPFNGMDYVIIRTYSAGVFAGYLKDVSGDVVTLVDARRIWKWEGAASLSQLAKEGTSKPDECKFPCPVDSIRLNNWIEIIDCTEKAKASISGVDIWEE